MNSVLLSNLFWRECSNNTFSDELHSILTPAATFTAKTRHATSAEPNHQHYPRCSICKAELPLRTDICGTDDFVDPYPITTTLISSFQASFVITTPNYANNNLPIIFLLLESHHTSPLLILYLDGLLSLVFLCHNFSFLFLSIR